MLQTEPPELWPPKRVEEADAQVQRAPSHTGGAGAGNAEGGSETILLRHWPGRLASFLGSSFVSGRVLCINRSLFLLHSRPSVARLHSRTFARLHG